VLEMADGLHGTLLDLYCGVGLFSSFLADVFDQIIGIEASSSACKDFAENLDQYEHISLYEGTVEEVLPGLDIKPDCALVDPPRKGLDRFALDALVEKKSPVLIYVSCNPATLARDVKRLMRSGYTLESSILVDMFPQTYHIESVNLLHLK
jgi:23S rRNA (uracil1939-C5)-methyltransferase